MLESQTNHRQHLSIQEVSVMRSISRGCPESVPMGWIHDCGDLVDSSLTSRSFCVSSPLKPECIQHCRDFQISPFRATSRLRDMPASLSGRSANLETSLSLNIRRARAQGKTLLSGSRGILELKMLIPVLLVIGPFGSTSCRQSGRIVSFTTPTKETQQQQLTGDDEE